MNVSDCIYPLCGMGSVPGRDGSISRDLFPADHTHLESRWASPSRHMLIERIRSNAAQVHQTINIVMGRIKRFTHCIILFSEAESGVKPTAENKENVIEDMFNEPMEDE